MNITDEEIELLDALATLIPHAKNAIDKLLAEHEASKDMQWVSVDNVERNTWYWYTSTQEPDIHYPCFIADDLSVIIDGNPHDLKLCKDILFQKAVLPPLPSEKKSK